MKKIILTLLSISLLSFSLFEKEAEESVEGRKKYAVGEMEAAGDQFSAAGERLKDNAEAFMTLLQLSLQCRSMRRRSGTTRRLWRQGRLTKIYVPAFFTTWEMRWLV